MFQLQNVQNMKLGGLFDHIFFLAWFWSKLAKIRQILKYQLLLALKPLKRPFLRFCFSKLSHSLLLEKSVSQLNFLNLRTVLLWCNLINASKITSRTTWLYFEFWHFFAVKTTKCQFLAVLGNLQHYEQLFPKSEK